MTAERLAIPALLNYDSAVDWRARIEREGPFLLGALADAPSRRVVDLGSGTGEHARWLAGQGFEVVGIEGVRERWELAKELAVPGVEFLIGDLGAVEAMVRGQFGAALCLGNTLPALIGAEAVSRMFIGLRRRFLPGRRPRPPPVELRRAGAPRTCASSPSAACRAPRASSSFARARPRRRRHRDGHRARPTVSAGRSCRTGPAPRAPPLPPGLAPRRAPDAPRRGALSARSSATADSPASLTTSISPRSWYSSRAEAAGLPDLSGRAKGRHRSLRSEPALGLRACVVRMRGSAYCGKASMSPSLPKLPSGFE